MAGAAHRLHRRPGSDADLRAARSRPARGDCHRPPARRRSAADRAASWPSSSRSTPNTVARVYAELERDGVIETRRGVGSFVSATPAPARSAGEHTKRLRAFVTRMLPTRLRQASARRAGRRARRAREARFVQAMKCAGDHAAPKGARRWSPGSFVAAVNRLHHLAPAPQHRRDRDPARVSRAGAAGVGDDGLRRVPVGRAALARPGADAVAEGRAAVGARVVLRLGRFIGLQGPGPVLDHPVRRRGVVLDRSADDHDELRRRADADLRHGAR